MRETENCEFKKSTSELDESLNSIAAILNKHKKGELYFGLNNNGELTHQIISEKTLRDISQKSQITSNQKFTLSSRSLR